MQPPINDIQFEFCDFLKKAHTENLITLLNEYMADPMGGAPKLSPQQELELINGLSGHPASFVLFMNYKNDCIGMAACFINFSTFNVKPYLNIHDIIIHKPFRGKGFGRMLLKKLIEIATDNDYCKITLEVRGDNHNAKVLYRSLGFADTEPVMHFWTKVI